MNEVITLNTDSPEIQHLCKVDKRLAKVISMVGEISYQLYADPYDFFIHEIIEQMLSAKSGYVIYSRLEKLCDGKIIPEVVDALTIKEIRSIGTSYSKADYIKSLTHSVMSGEIDFEAFKTMSDEELIKHLTNLKGIGIWTAHMYLIFVLNRQDVLPTSDVAFLQVYERLYKTKDRSKSSVEKKCKKWKPYSSIAARYFYRLLDEGYTKNEFHLFK